MIVSLIIEKMIMIMKSMININDNHDDNYFNNNTNNKDNNNYSNDEDTKGLYSWSMFCIFSLIVTAIIISLLSKAFNFTDVGLLKLFPTNKIIFDLNFIPGFQMKIRNAY